MARPRAARSIWSLAGWLLALTVGISAFVVWYVGREHFIYFWDFVHYQLNYQELARTLATGPVAAARDVVTSMRWDDYSDLPIAPLTPLTLVFGDGRLAYVLSIALLYALPTIVLITALARELKGSVTEAAPPAASALTWIVPGAVVALCPQLWVPVLRGFPDVIGTATLTLAMLLYLRRPAASRRLTNALALGALLGLTVLLRRWYAYSIIGFFAGAGLRELLLLRPVWRDGRRHVTREALRSVAYLALAGVTAVVLVFALAWPTAVRMLTTDYHDIYSAYRTPQTVLQQFGTLIGYFGLVWLAAVVVALIVVARRGRRDVALFLGVNMVVTYATFRRTQDFGMQHYYPLLVPALTLIGIALIHALARVRATRSRVLLTAGVLAAAAANFLIVLDPAAGRHVPGGPAFFASERGYPLRRSDLPEIASLLHRVDSLVGSSSDSVYVLASGLRFNDAILRNAPATLGSGVARGAERVLGTDHIDKRDGFPGSFFRAQYVIVTDPVAYHRAPEGQQVIGLLANQLLDDRGVGRAFHRLPGSIRLASGREVYIYEKDSHIQAADVEALATSLGDAHPRSRSRFVVTPQFVRAAAEAPPAATQHGDGSAQ